MKNLKSIYITISLVFLSTMVMGQQINTMYFMNSVPQSARLNPGKQSENKWAIAIPVTNMSLHSYTGISLNDVTYRANDSTFLDIDGILDELDNENNELAALSTQLFGLYYQKHKWGFNFRVNYTTIQHMTYTKGLMNTVLRGPASESVFGQQQKLESVIDAVAFADVSLGGNYRINDKLVVGASVKVLFGTHNVEAKINGNIYQEDEANLGLIVGGDLEVSANGLGDIVDEEGNIDFQSDELTKSFSTLNNVGFAVDLGATYQFSDKLTFEASAINLGAIYWKNDNQYNYTAPLQDVSFEGMDPVQLIEGNTDNVFPSLTDTISFSNIDSRKPDNTVLPASINLAATYEFWDRATAGALFSQTFYKGVYYPSFTMSVDKQFGKWFGLGLSYTGNKYQAFNLGGMISIGFPGFQFYVLSDNIITAAMDYSKIKGGNLRFGINLPFGKVKNNDIPPSLQKRLDRNNQ
ncbi:hypothetical protein KMW28_06490 [Flammeovirga yaeyamensis]|uniref:DUF5723 domain-containing protein n=1 Tax=Flammeovirga yaeyamensis TaxID=367791 RepID=A0AAX1N6V7_9BACT|nr:DUF5723 family protein [Flammeovirga yaeyamensis]MBB3697821.1 hypothetical protein [Flammeovirga yaeyamensis]NMF35823.1 hypothetical protein [Flammeovirga yaeyamensis]QWG03225.1 hypothetical protein KMW28_06490 [Flammeovirga yaeyamensis]